jgi:VIT1/CCC1 family predicted Fe2+/Mn2+ transporter
MQTSTSPPAAASEPSPHRSRRRILEPVERVSEVLFGLIMVLTFTGSISAAEAGRAEIRTMLLGALGCNLAWGLIDGIMYLMACISERARGIDTVLAVRKATNPEAAWRVIADALPPVVASVLQPAELERVRQQLSNLPPPPARPRLGGSDWLGAVAVFLWVFLCTFPVVIPFVFMTDTMRALRVSNAIAIGLLFLTGYAFGRCARMPPWLAGAAMVVLGAVLVGITMALGG